MFLKNSTDINRSISFSEVRKKIAFSSFPEPVSRLLYINYFSTSHPLNFLAFLLSLLLILCYILSFSLPDTFLTLSVTFSPSHFPIHSWHFLLHSLNLTFDKVDFISLSVTFSLCHFLLYSHFLTFFCYTNVFLLSTFSPSHVQFLPLLLNSS